MVALRACVLIIVVVFLNPGGLLYASNQETLDYVLEVSIDVRASKIEGVASIRLKAGDKILLQKGPLRIRSVRLGRQSVAVSEHEGMIPITASRQGVLRIDYEGIFSPRATGIGREQPEYGSIIDEKGISLTGTWYPRLDRICRYHLTAALPHNFEAISEAESSFARLRGAEKVFSFTFPYPIDQITLVASNQYKVVKERFGGVDIVAYFFSADVDLAPTYIAQTKKYLKLYGEMLGPYPYKRFCIVENILPTGFSMPTFTLLGQDVVRLPFIPDTSLGHEVLHQWFGNLVYIDYAKGNWAEGLTTYLADHLFEEQKNAGAAYRKALLVDYQSYVHEGNEFPLSDFRSRTDYASKAIGYGKAAMVFHMLKQSLGNDTFLRSLRYFISTHRNSRASWEDLQRAFEKESGKELKRFFKQWVKGKGLPHISPEDARTTRTDGRWVTDTTLVQWGEPYLLDVPVTVSWNGGEKRETFRVEKNRTRLEVSSGSMPEKTSLDSEYDIARRLSEREFPPVIARLLGSEKTLLVNSPATSSVYKEVVDTFVAMGAILKDAGSVNDADLAGASLILLGTDNPVTLRLFNRMQTQGDFSVIIRNNPLNPSRVAAVVHATSREAVSLAFNKIFHYGRYSHVTFEHGRNIDKTLRNTESGIIRDVVALPKLDQAIIDALAKIVRQLALAKIIYVGESHDRFADHLVQLEVIKELHSEKHKVAIGMEMFPRTAQPALDRYITGMINERQFLRESRYFTGWGFDYNLYRPILNFARAQGIPVVALNAEQETVRKVFRGGLNGLSIEERASIPSQLDLSDKAYEERLKKVFGQHEASNDERFDFFYQAQVLWDESMAESITEFLKAHPYFQMVVLAGSGHLAYRSGIPGRASRRTSLPSVVMLNDADSEKGAADYLLSPREVPFTPAPKLGVFLKEEKSKVIIQSFGQGSIAEKAGMKAGDAIYSIDGEPVASIDEAKIELLFHKSGDRIKVGVLRRQDSGEEKQIEFELVL